MARLALWTFAFSPVLLVSIPAVRQHWGLFPLWLLLPTVLVCSVAELVLMKRRGAPGIPGTAMGNWFTKLFTVVFAIMELVLIYRLART